MSIAWLQRFPRMRLLHAALVALLLFVQHGALNHALLHVARNGQAEVHTGHAVHAHVHDHHVHDHHVHDHHAHGHHAHGGEQPSGEWSASCGFDLLYCEVLGGVPGSSWIVANDTAGIVLLAAAMLAAAGTADVPYNSRAPPAFS